MITSLKNAIQNNKIKIVKSLLKNGENPNSILDNNQTTSLCIASTEGYIEIVKLLLEHGADVNLSNNNKDSPLHCASYNGHIEIVKLLLNYNANIYAMDDWNYTPENIASQRKHSKIVKIFQNKQNKIENNKQIESSDIDNTELILKKEKLRIYFTTYIHNTNIDEYDGFIKYLSYKNNNQCKLVVKILCDIITEQNKNIYKSYCYSVNDQSIGKQICDIQFNIENIDYILIFLEISYKYNK
jgi:ankyrin repeat protein